MSQVHRKAMTVTGSPKSNDRGDSEESTSWPLWWCHQLVNVY